MIHLGLTLPSNSQWASPLHKVPKKHNNWRPCGDYRVLNVRTSADKYPLRNLQDFAQAPYGKIVFLIIGLVRAFNQVPVVEEYIPKTAITTPFCFYVFPFITFDLCNAEQTFERFIDEALRSLNFCYAYIDDILVASFSVKTTPAT